MYRYGEGPRRRVREREREGLERAERKKKITTREGHAREETVYILHYAQ